MFERQNTISRGNTYLPREFYKTIVISSTKEKAELSAQWLTESTTPNRGVYACKYNSSQMIVFFRWPSLGEKQATTVAVESLLIFADTEEELEFIKPEISKYGIIPVVVIVSKNDMKTYAANMRAAYFNQELGSSKFKIELDVLDKKQLQIIKNKFTEFDSDSSGFIDSEEMRKIAISLGENPDREDFQQSMLALDFNGDNTISFTEFISWWKIGRQNTLTLPKIYLLNMNTKDFVSQNINFPNYVNELSKVKNDSKSKQRIYFRNPGNFRLKSFFECSLAVGGQMRNNMACDFLSQFTKNAKSIAKNNWISILIALNEKKKKIDPSVAKQLLEEFKDNMLKWGEMNNNPVFVAFVKNLMVFEFSSNEKNVILVARLKIDIEELVKGAISQIIYIIKNLSEKEESFWFNLKTHSNCDLYEALKTNTKVNLGNFFSVFELLFEGSCFRTRLKNLYNNLNTSYKEYFNFLKLLFMPYDINLELDGDFNEFIDENSKILMNTSLENISFVLEFLKKNLDSELLAAANNFEIGINFFDVFARVKFYSQSVFSSEFNLPKV